jgi:hypothetical protein
MKRQEEILLKELVTWEEQFLNSFIIFLIKDFWSGFPYRSCNFENLTSPYFSELIQIFNPRNLTQDIASSLERLKIPLSPV